MQSDKWLLFSPFLIVIMGIIILYGLIRLNKRIKDWKIISLSLMPTMFIILYTWIGVFHPPYDISKIFMRSILISSMGLSIHVIAEYIKNSKRAGK